MRSRATVTGALLIAALGVGFISCAKSGADSGCGKAPADSSEPPPRNPLAQRGRPWKQIRIYYGSRLPKCYFAELGYIREEPGGSLQERAWNMGADAVIEVKRKYVRDAGGIRRLIWTEGIAIQFTDRECMY